MKLSMSDIAQAISSVKAPSSSGCVTGVSTDSRSVAAGDLFVAIRGPHFDGHQFVQDVLDKGAVAAVVDEKSGVVGDRIFVVNDTVRALGDLAAFYRRSFASTPRIAITGSNGKTTTKEMVAAVVSVLGPVHKTEGNFNNLFGLPLTIFKWRPEHRVSVLEMGMNELGEIARMTDIADPTIGVVTTVQAVHLENLHSIENVAKAKGELYSHMRPDGIIIVNQDNDYIQPYAAAYRGRAIRFGMRNGCDVQFGHMQSDGLSSTDVTFSILGHEVRVVLPVPGAHNVMNAMAAAAVGVALDIDREAIVEGLSRFTPMKMRMERLQLANGVQVINDCYNANLQSMIAALRTVSAAKRAGRFIAVLGDMLELGEKSDVFHSDLGRAAAEYGVDSLFAFGEFSDDVKRGASEKGLANVVASQDIEMLAEKVHAMIQPGDVVLVKGSRGVKMERVIDFLKYKVGV